MFLLLVFHKLLDPHTCFLHFQLILMFVTVLSLNHEHRDCCIKHTRSSVYDVIHADVFMLGSFMHMTRYPLTHIVQPDSVSDSDSENRNKNEEIIPVNRLTQTVCTDPPARATSKCPRTDKQRTFFGPNGAASRNRSRNLICLHCR
jgi:hypothetical protein